MSRVAEVLDVARSNLADRLSRPARRSRGSYAKADDAELLPVVRGFVDERPTYGYRRITALVNRQRAHNGLQPVNHKRIYRLMKISGLLLQRHTGRREGRTHDGTVVVMRSNLRWCSDALEFTSWNGDIVRVAFIIDAHDREVIAWIAICGAGISGSDVRDMMLQAIEKRFGAPCAPAPIEHLSDNGSAYTARQTRDFALALNLVPCFTPVASPQSNGISEAFVKTFKRDYVRVSQLPDGETALRQIAGWIEDYNEIHPHSALKMCSPREFIRAKT